MAAPIAEAASESTFRLPFRLRSVVLLAFVALASWWAYPRANAAVSLHASANQFADYALCMVGPTGPNLLRDDPEAFLELARRRVVGAQPADRPFQQCGAAAFELTGSRAVERAHGAMAWSFEEYGSSADQRLGGPAGTVRVEQLRVTTEHLADLAEAAWPFSRGGYTRLIKRSPNAREAVHPAPVPRPTLGSGLPAWRARYRAVERAKRGWVVAFGKGALLELFESGDGGLTWAPVSVGGASVGEFAERCPAGDRAYHFGLDEDGTHHTVTSVGPDRVPTVAELADSDLVVFAAACDKKGLVAALKPEHKRDVTFMWCPFRASCVPMTAPEYEGVRAQPRYPLDVARVDGTTVVAINMGEVVRVTSSRDDGATWAPLTVAFDRAAHPDFQAHVPIPRRLLALGSSLFLYGGAPKTTETYPVLVSDDQGATWREPQL
jgi:hypothetical protein